MASMSASKPPRILACVLCQHRKIKCDRTFPCSNCVKANSKCVPSTPAPTRKRRRPNQDLQERLARCEQLLKEYATDKPESPEPQPQQQQPLPSLPIPQQVQLQRSSELPNVPFEDPYAKWKAPGKLIKDDGGMRFMDSYLLGTIYDELRAMREIVDSEESTEDLSTESATPDDNSDLLLGVDTPASSVEDLQPDAGHVFRLWQIYLDRVNPLTKIIHVPSVQPYLVEAASSSSTLPKGMEALLFSIYLLATISLSPDECQSVLGYGREEAMQRFSRGVRLSLLRNGFLKSHDLVTLQALVNYQISLQGRYNRHAAWVLNGVVLRMAQKMGLHRDGEHLGLSPFETEMRRRVWWQIIMVDAKYAMFSGMSPSLLPRGWDTKPPKNVNDADLFPSTNEPIQDREGPTEMIFCMISYRMGKYLVEFPGFEAMMVMQTFESGRNPNGPGAAQIEEFKRILQNMSRDLLDALDKYCDPSAGPLHEMAMGMKNHILEKLSALVKPPDAQMELGSSGEARTPQDNAFKIAVNAMEGNSRHYEDTKDKGFLWFTLLHFQPDLFTYMVAQLCLRTDGDLVERAWLQVQRTFDFHPELYDMGNRSYALTAQYLFKAWRRREQVLAARTGQVPDPPDYIVKLRRLLPHEFAKSDGTPDMLPTPVSQSRPSLPGGAPPMTDVPMDNLLSGYLDFGTLDWDMWANINPANATNAGGAFGSFGMGPSTDW